MLSNIWVWDPGSGIRKKPIPDPGSRGQKGTGSRIRIRNTGGQYIEIFWKKYSLAFERIRQSDADPTGSGSTTLVKKLFKAVFPTN
jgi:hypothetical protein